jgi:hypothetical protein
MQNAFQPAEINNIVDKIASKTICKINILQTPQTPATKKHGNISI